MCSQNIGWAQFCALEQPTAAHQDRSESLQNVFPQVVISQPVFHWKCNVRSYNAGFWKVRSGVIFATWELNAGSKGLNIDSPCEMGRLLLQTRAGHPAPAQKYYPSLLFNLFCSINSIKQAPRDPLKKVISNTALLNSDPVEQRPLPHSPMANGLWPGRREKLFSLPVSSEAKPGKWKHVGLPGLYQDQCFTTPPTTTLVFDNAPVARKSSKGLQAENQVILARILPAQGYGIAVQISHVFVVIGLTFFRDPYFACLQFAHF
ncbi:uncharacterized protein BDR25DRAFT_350665 [Lindgomyces ingoldianus]|uniref:Uncharacterized protein n=1 Tax=Lindgomyces ingoldianus TaxID=673940 RepID=A0ACB6R7J2_9PLEO|nr:uncharacterized protein BDR25DRAFT_350665 [Lindgomyces ingoldianus]KAF2475278.1 hypothetical protein BDR25DRAFT_350665 [Lindgomyces ingoldianus]